MKASPSKIMKRRGKSCSSVSKKGFFCAFHLGGHCIVSSFHKFCLPTSWQELSITTGLSTEVRTNFLAPNRIKKTKDAHVDKLSSCLCESLIPSELSQCWKALCTLPEGRIIISHTHLCTFKSYANAQPGKTYSGMNVMGMTSYLLIVFKASSTS